MRRLLFFIITLAIATYLGLLIKDDPGYLLLSYKKWAIEMPLWLAGGIVLLTYFALHIIMRILRNLAITNHRLFRWFSRRKEDHVRSKTSQGLIDLSEGNWKAAEKSLTKSA